MMNYLGTISDWGPKKWTGWHAKALKNAGGGSGRMNAFRPGGKAELIVGEGDLAARKWGAGTL